MPFSLPGLAEVYGVDPAWSSSQLLTGSSERLSRNTPEKKPPKKATGCWVSSLKIGVSSLRNIFVSPCAADACMTDSSGILACPAGLAAVLGVRSHTCLSSQLKPTQHRRIDTLRAKATEILYSTSALAQPGFPQAE